MCAALLPGSHASETVCMILPQGYDSFHPCKPPAGASRLPVARGVVRWFDLNAGVGMIAQAGSGDDAFFHFTGIPGQGYRTIRPGTPAQFEVVETRTGPNARHIQQIKEPTL